MDTHAQQQLAVRPHGDCIDAESLFRVHAGFVARFLQRLGVAEAELDDCVQDVFLLAQRKGGYIPGPAKPRTWLAVIGARVASEGRRADRVRRLGAEPRDGLRAPADHRDAAHALELRDSLARVQAALDTIDLEHRVAFVLYEIEGETCPQIAAAVGVSIGSVYSRLHDARQRFFAAYGREDGDHLAGAALRLAPAGPDWIPPLRLRHDHAVDQAMRADLEGASCAASDYDDVAGLSELQASMAQGCESAAHAATTAEAAVVATKPMQRLTRKLRHFAASAGRAAALLGASAVLVRAPEAPARPLPVANGPMAPAPVARALQIDSLRALGRTALAEPDGQSALHREIMEPAPIEIETAFHENPVRTARVSRNGE